METITQRLSGREQKKDGHQLNSWKQDFPLFQKMPRLVYLDNSATAQKPLVVIAAMNQYYEQENANVHRGLYELSEKATQAYEDAHRIVAEFINATAEEIIFTKGTTESLNLVASSLGKTLHQCDEIVLTEMEHHSNIVPWQQVAREKGAVLKYISVTPEGLLNMDEARHLITKKTKVVSAVHMSNVLGTINPIKDLAKLAHQAGALLVVDAAQSVPHLPVDVRDLGSDFLAFSGHKMGGPTGIGVLYGRKEILERLAPYQCGGGMIREVTKEYSTWNDLPWKFEAGTPNIAGVIGLAAAVQFLQKKGMKEIQKHGEDITRYAYKKLRAMSRVQILGPEVLISEDIDPEGSQTPAVRGALVSFTVAGIHPHDVAEICNRYGLAVRAGYQCAMPLHKKLGINGSVRASFYFYTTTKEIDALVQALQDAERIFHG